MACTVGGDVVPSNSEVFTSDRPGCTVAACAAATCAGESASAGACACGACACGAGVCVGGAGAFATGGRAVATTTAEAFAGSARTMGCKATMSTPCGAKRTPVLSTTMLRAPRRRLTVPPVPMSQFVRWPSATAATGEWLWPGTAASCSCRRFCTGAAPLGPLPVPAPAPPRRIKRNGSSAAVPCGARAATKAATDAVVAARPRLGWGRQSMDAYLMYTHMEGGTQTRTRNENT
mmetsp:Transcript_6721/g.18481  ORF Transcript_6721/g.18481 Transcript_6721/m.18481 type:complete len:234 (-) Transcript_6721:9-710(-)